MAFYGRDIHGRTHAADGSDRFLDGLGGCLLLALGTPPSPVQAGPPGKRYDGFLPPGVAEHSW